VGGVETGALDGLVIIPTDFASRLADPRLDPLVEIVTDGSQPNTANFVANYAQGW
jgi:ABC-2 type transport system permease protein